MMVRRRTSIQAGRATNHSKHEYKQPMNNNEEEYVPAEHETYNTRVCEKTLGCLRDARDHPMPSRWVLKSQTPFAVVARYEPMGKNFCTGFGV